MAIDCSEINQTVNELLIAFQNCKIIKNTDLIKLVELVSAVNVCANGGADYSTQIQDIWQPVVDEEIIYPVDSFHSISVMVLEGNITQDINSTIVTFPTGTSLNTEVTTTNQTPFIFTVKAGSKVVVNYLIETV